MIKVILNNLQVNLQVYGLMSFVLAILASFSEASQSIFVCIALDRILYTKQALLCSQRSVIYSLVLFRGVMGKSGSKLIGQVIKLVDPLSIPLFTICANTGV